MKWVICQLGDICCQNLFHSQFCVYRNLHLNLGCFDIAEVLEGVWRPPQVDDIYQTDSSENLTPFDVCIDNVMNDVRDVGSLPIINLKSQLQKRICEVCIIMGAHNISIVSFIQMLILFLSFHLFKDYFYRALYSSFSRLLKGYLFKDYSSDQLDQCCMDRIRCPIERAGLTKR